jgi:ketosteroid isomerase-like protein
MSDTITAAELAELVAQTEAAGAAWMRGDASVYDALNTHEEDYTIMGPFGGPTAKGYRSWSERSSHIVKNFKNGACKLRVIQSYASGDILVLVLEEDQQGEIGGQAAQSWALRVTQVYRREGDAWKAVHRHADPLSRPRALQESLALART